MMRRMQQHSTALDGHRDWLLAVPGVLGGEVTFSDGRPVICVTYTFELSRASREAILDRLAGCNVLLMPQGGPRQRG